MTDQTKQEKEKLISDAQAFLKGGNKTPDDILAFAKALHKQDEFEWARRVLEKSISCDDLDENLRQRVAQLWALSTYKDTQLNRKKALNEALKILQDELDLANTKNQETLGLAGAIFKRKWETGGIKAHLEHSLNYYHRGYQQGVAGDDAYTAINAAYILDLLAYLELKQAGEHGASSNVAAERRIDAQKIREKIISHLSKSLKNKKLEKGNYWQIVTLAEAYFGTANYQEAWIWLEKALLLDEIAEWERISTAKQLVYLAKLQADIDISDEQLKKQEAWQTLTKFLGKKAYALHSMSRGKVGLALSGGGFRSSFYHIGVLAKLAELDLLRHVEVLSCVSGGSILGAHYYLEFRRFINQEKIEDKKITRDHYVQLVENVADDFLAGVQENPRVKLLVNPLDNLKMIFFSNYSRTQRLGGLYEKMIYSRVKDDGKRWLNGLFIHPVKQPKFLPRRDNWSRLSKIPELILNSTTLNTGHNWQFTASWMGESPTQIDPDVDTNDRYRRTYYKDAPKPHKEIRLGTAVGASSCVPGLFEPIILQGLYKDTTVRLIDGGVYDNQGVAGLLEQDCNVIISSDATGQMNTEKDPGGGVLKPLLRSNTTLMQRVRDSQYQDMKERKTAGILKGFAYTHLKQGLEGENVAWFDSKELDHAKSDPDAKTNYGIRKDIQQLLAGIRTDLDSFSDLEAYALMTSGYCAMGVSVEESLQGFPLDHKSAKPKWKFLDVEPAMTQEKAGGEQYDRLTTNLQASSMTFGKVWKLDPTLNKLIKGLAGILVLSLIVIWYNHPGWQPFSGILSLLASSLTIGVIGGTIVTLVIVSLAAKYLGDKEAEVVDQALNFQDIPRQVLVGAGIGLVGWIGARIHLKYFDKKFLKIGQVKEKTISD